jgi:hypothetical protein
MDSKYKNVEIDPNKIVPIIEDHVHESPISKIQK